MKISVITVCKNAEKDIEQCIQSVVKQTYKNLEYIIIDGYSQDGTQEIIRKYFNQISRFISEPDKGLYQAMNKGIRYASGDFICFLNADDYFIDSEVIADVAQFLENHPDCDFVYGDIEVRYPTKKAVVFKPPKPEGAIEELICGCLPHQASFTKTNLFFGNVGFFSECYRISSDYEWFLKLVANEAVKLCYFPRTISSYYTGGLSSQIRLSVPESYRIQNQFPLFQQEYWLKKRLLKFQEVVINLREYQAHAENRQDVLEIENQLLRTQYQTLEEQYQQTKAALEKARATIISLKSDSVKSGKT